MFCKDCKLKISHAKAPKLTSCPLCGNPLVPNGRDILNHGLYGIVKEVREAQIKMAEDIEVLFMQDNGTLLAEGQTGTGKSYAYLIPALLRDDKRVIISTAKIPLQDQLYKKDLPVLCQKLGISTDTYGVYKGRNNYLCRNLVKRLNTKDKAACAKFIKEIGQSPADKSNWPEDEIPKWWSKVSADNCPNPKTCQYSNYCTPQPSKYRILITNHSLLGIDLKIRGKDGGILGPYNTLIIDEGHRAAECFHDTFSFEIKLDSVIKLIEGMSWEDDLINFIEDVGALRWATCIYNGQNLCTALERTYYSAKKASNAAKLVDVSAITQQLKKLQDAAEIFHCNFSLLNGILHDALTEEQERFEYSETQEGHLIWMLSRTKRYQNTAHKLAELCAGVLEGDPATQIVTADDKIIKVKPLEIGPLLEPKLQQIPYKIITSATLALGTDFTRTITDLGIPSTQPVTTQVYQSPFRVKNRTLLYLPLHLPIPAHAGKPPEIRRNWIEASATETAQIMDALRGDAFVLFTSRVDMEEHIERLNRENYWQRAGLTLCAQTGAAQPTLDKFMRTPNSVIFGLKSFWEGIDVPGPKLKMVIIPKLPFPNPYDPLLIARQNKIDAEKGQRAGFNELSVPQMITDMRQAIGRLLRTAADRGFIAITDPRIWTATSNEDFHRRRIASFRTHPGRAQRTGYAKRLMDALDLPNQTYDFNDVALWAERWFNIKNNYVKKH